jgi:hypothetical protein
MHNPEDIALIPKLKYAELLICLPADWPLTEAEFAEEKNYWPIYWLKALARLPHEYNSWLGVGHTIPNGDPPLPLHKSVPFSGWIVDKPLTFHEEFNVLKVGNKAINFYCIAPLYLQELDFKLRKGADSLFKMLDTAKVAEVIDCNRQCAIP